MSHRTCLAVAGICLLVTLLPVPRLFAQGTRLNVLVMITDDQQADAIGAMRDTLGNGDGVNVETPNIDRLSESSVVFNQAYIMGSWSGAVCRPSRTMIMTGRTLWHIPGKSGNTPAPDQANKSLPAAFNAAGYDTLRSGKSQNVYADANAKFQTSIAHNNRGATASQLFADDAIDFLDSRQSSGDTDPFMVYLGFSHPHDPRTAPPDLLAKYGASVPDPDPNAPLSSMPPLPPNYLPRHPFDNGELSVRDETSVQGVGTKRDERTVRNEIAKNYATTEYIDSQIGRVLAKLEEVGEADNTIIVFTSDHGLAVGRHGLMGKQNLYEHTLRAPLMISAPGVAPGETDANAYLLDLFPTLCDLAGIAYPDSVEGYSLAPILRGEAGEVREAIFGAYKDVQRSVRVGDWKLIHYPKIGRTQLFNLADDPSEINDLAHDVQYVGRVEELADRLRTLQEEYDDPITGKLGRIGVNVAMGKSATQSSEFGVSWAAENAVDGAGSTLSSGIHTAVDDANAWWMVDLGETTTIEEIVMKNRAACCQGRLRDITVEILDENMAVVFTSEMLNPDNVLGGGTNDFATGPATLLLPLFDDLQDGRYVRILRTGTDAPGPKKSDQYVLSLEEVQVFAVPEPSSLLLLAGLGMALCLAGWHWRLASD